MAIRRTKSIGTKVTEEEYARLEALAGGQRLSEWVRRVLLSAAEPSAAEPIVLAELLALRTILLNLHFAVCQGNPLRPRRCSGSSSAPITTRSSRRMRAWHRP